MKYGYVKYCMMRWDMIQDSWIEVEDLSIVIEWSLVDNLAILKKQRKLCWNFQKKNPIILDVLFNTWH